MAQLMEVPRPADVTGPRSDVRLLGDLAAGIVGDSIGVGVSLLRKGSRLPGLRSRVVWRPAFVPTRYQPASLLAAVARRGEEHRSRTIGYLERLLDTWTPLIVETLVSRLDLDAIVGRIDLNAAVAGVDIDAIAGRIDVDAIIGRVDLVVLIEEVLAEIDLAAIIRESSSSVASEGVRGARMTGISADEAISRALERHLFRRRGQAPSIADPP